MQKISTLLFLLTIAWIHGIGQDTQYNYRSKLSGIASNWHAIELPNSIYAKVNEDLSDIRIFGIDENNDTIEVPYILKENTTKYETEKVYSDVINESQVGERYFYTIENDDNEKINTLELDFSNDNFDWYVKLEGSNNERRWFTILKNERILAINNGSVNYKHTTLNFSTVTYKYLRLSFNSNTEPELYDASIWQTTKNKGVLQTYEPIAVKVHDNYDWRTTVVDIDLEETVPVSKISVNVNDKIDYYRPIEIQRLIDSVETPDGWKPYYEDLTEKTLSSLEPNIYTFDYKLANTLQLIIYNHDNEELNIGDIKVEGNIIQLLARFNKPARYYLYYGKDGASSPYYDITEFENTIPSDIQTLFLQEEEILTKDEFIPEEDKSVNQYWLWAIMALIIVIIGGFTISMLKDEKL